MRARRIKGRLYAVTLKDYTCNVTVVSARGKKSVVRSVRITKELDDILRQDAQGAGITMNAMISSILGKYSEWDRYAEQFGFVTITGDGFRVLLEAIEKEKLTEIAEDIAPSLSREVALHFFKRVDFETFFQFLLALFRYGHLGEYQVETTAEGDTLTVHHDLGPNWSLLLSRSIKQSFKAISNISPQVSIEENTFMLAFPAHTLDRGRPPEG